MYEDLRYRTPTTAVLLEPAISQMRLIVMALSFVFMEHVPYFQIFFNNVLVKIVIIFTLGQDVYSDPTAFFF